MSEHIFESLQRYAYDGDLQNARAASRHTAGNLADLRAKSLMRADPKLDYSSALAEVYRREPSLRDQYLGRTRGWEGDL